MKKLKFLTLIISLICFMAVTGCNFSGNAPSSETEGVDRVVITVGEDFPLTDSTVLLDYMNYLKGKGEIDYSISDGMITEVNGVANTADFSKCWMVYTDDSDFSSSEWGGSITVDGKTYNSAALGVNALPIKTGKTYVLAYMSF